MHILIYFWGLKIFFIEHEKSSDRFEFYEPITAFFNYHDFE